MHPEPLSWEWHRLVAALGFAVVVCVWIAEKIHRRKP
jgi:hypothetical protein